MTSNPAESMRRPVRDEESRALLDATAAAGSGLRVGSLLQVEVCDDLVVANRHAGSS